MKEGSFERVEVERDPQVRVEFFFNAHVSAEDVQGLEAMLRNADVFVPESLGWSMEGRQLWQAVADGRAKPSEVPAKEEARKKELEMVAGSKIRIMFLDAGEYSPVTERAKKARQALEADVKDFCEGSFDRAVENFALHSLEFAEAMRERETVMKKNIREQLPELTKRFPELRGREEIKVVIALGAAHTPLYHELKAEGVSVARTMSRPLTTFAQDIELMRRGAFFGKDDSRAQATKLEAARGLLVYILEDHYAPNKSSEKNDRLLRQAVASLTLDDIREIAEQKLDPRSLPYYLEQKVGLPSTGYGSDRKLEKDPRFQGHYSES